MWNSQTPLQPSFHPVVTAFLCIFQYFQFPVAFFWVHFSTLQPTFSPPQCIFTPSTYFNVSQKSSSNPLQPLFFQIQHFPLFASRVFVLSFVSCSCLFLPVPGLFIFSIYSALADSQLIAAVYYPASVCLIRMSVAVRECLTWAQWLSALTAHKRAVIPCVKDCCWHGPFNLTPSKVNGPSSPPNLYSQPWLYSHLYPSSCFLQHQMKRRRFEMSFRR